MTYTLVAAGHYTVAVAGPNKTYTYDNTTGQIT